MSMQNSRWIFQTMVLSLLLNVALIGVFFYFLIRNNPLQFSYRPKVELKSKQPPLPPQFLAKLTSVPFDQLVQFMEDDRKLDNGFRVRDTALGALAAFHHFDVERGLGRGKLSKQIWEYEGNYFILFPGITDQDFETLKTFAQTDKWPMTTEGLFKKIQQSGIENSDPALISFFCHRPEFVLFETLFARTRLPIQKRNVLNLALEGGWEMFASFSAEQEKGIDLTDDVRRKLLVGAIENGSKTGAYLLLITDNSYAIEQLGDAHLAKLLDLLTVKTPEALQFAQTISSGQRIAAVKQRAQLRIKDYTGHAPQEVAISKPSKQVQPALTAAGSHVVQEGESLWVIARKYKVSVDALAEANQIKNGVIRPGKTLKIPLP